MQPSELADYQELRANGMNVWREAQSYRNQERLRLRAEGKSKRVANAESWELMREKYLAPPPAVMMARVRAMMVRARAASLADSAAPDSMP